jgi:rhodanese-related sulfurtransferase
VAAKLKERGFQRIRPLAGGFQAWVSAGFEVREEVVAEHPSPA